MIVVKNWKLLLGLFWDKISIEIMFDDRLVKKQALLQYKKADFTKWPYWLFSKGVTHDCGEKLAITSWFVLGEK